VGCVGDADSLVHALGHRSPSCAGAAKARTFTGPEPPVPRFRRGAGGPWHGAVQGHALLHRKGHQDSLHLQGHQTVTWSRTSFWSVAREGEPT